jgi:hypothetical protein
VVEYGLQVVAGAANAQVVMRFANVCDDFHFGRTQILDFVDEQAPDRNVVFHITFESLGLGLATQQFNLFGETVGDVVNVLHVLEHEMDPSVEIRYTNRNVVVIPDIMIGSSLFFNIDTKSGFETIFYFVRH